jgi:hypothetical protein
MAKAMVEQRGTAAAEVAETLDSVTSGGGEVWRAVAGAIRATAQAQDGL